MIATSINVRVLFSLSRIMSGLLLGMVLSIIIIVVVVVVVVVVVLLWRNSPTRARAA